MRPIHTSGSSTVAHRDAEDFTGTDRFLIARRLGAGAFGVVYEAYDRREKAPVALKVLRFAEADALYRFKKGIRSLAGVRHPNLVTFHGLESVDGWWLLIMELVSGVDLIEHLRGTSWDMLIETPPGADRLIHEDDSTATLAAPVRLPPETDYGRLRDVFAQLARGLEALHRHGRLHRDIKPSNVMVTREGRAVLLDFGLVTELERFDMLASGDNDLVGTPAYMAPEQAEGLPTSPASDWYSVGVMLYQALTDDLPFSGTILDVLSSKRRERPPDPRGLVPGLPDDLAQLCHGLLEVDVARRLTGEHVLERLGGSGSPDAASIAEAPAAGAPAAPPEAPESTFVGRRAALTALRQALFDSRGKAVTVYVKGPSGVGKTALIHHFLSGMKHGLSDLQHGPQRGHAGDAVVLMGRCFLQESVPYKALDSVIDALSRYLTQLPERDVEVLLPVHVDELARLFPVLRRLPGISRRPSLTLDFSDPQALRRRAFAGLRELLARLTERRRIVLFIDDLQWGDVDSFHLLEEILRPPDPPALLLVGCFRSEDRRTSPFLSALDEQRPAGDVREIDLGDLSAREAEQLVRTLAREGVRISSAEVAEIVREGGGSPLFLSELVGYSHDLRHRGPEGAPRPEGFGLSDMILARVAQLNETERRLLEVVAVSGKPLDLAAAAEAVGIDSGFGALVESLHAARLLRRVVAEDRNEVEAYHDRIREAVVADLDPAVKMAHHRRLATVLETTGSADPETLAVHFRATSEIQRARDYAIQAAEIAADTLAFERAARLYRLALDLTGPRGIDRYSLQMSLGHALAHAGRGREAADSLLAAVGASGQIDPLEAQRAAAEQLLISGHIDRGLAILRHVLRTVGMQFERRRRRSVAMLRWLRLRLWFLRTSGEWRFRERAEDDCDPELLRRIDVCWSVEIGLCLVDVLYASEFHARHLLLALEAGEPRRIARGMAMEVFFGSIEGGETRPALELARRLGARLEDRSIANLAEMAAGLRACMKGDWHEANRRLAIAEEHLCEEGTGVVWEIDTVQHFRILARLQLGRWAELFAELPQSAERARQRGDRYLEVHLRNWVESLRHLASDRPLRAAQTVEEAIAGWSHQGFHFQHFGHLMASTAAALYRGDAARAYDLVASRWPELVRSRIQRIEMVRVQSHDLRARAAIAAAGAEPAGRSALLRKARRDARRIERAGSSWAAALAAQLRAAVASLSGPPEAVRGQLEKAEALFLDADMPIHAALARRRRAQHLGEPARIKEADRALAAEGVRQPERLAAALAPGKWP